MAFPSHFICGIDLDGWLPKSSLGEDHISVTIAIPPQSLKNNN